jgi:8-oxo-dGTP diphosphatase
LCSHRPICEVAEETGLSIKNLRRGFTNDIYTKEGKHYITLFVLADYAGGKPQVLEPGKCTEWRWVSWDNLPTPLLLPVRNLRKQKFNPFT